jgi:hypothetical protein
MKELSICFVTSLAILVSVQASAQEPKISKSDMSRIVESLKTLNSYSVKYKGSRAVQSCTCKWAGGNTTCVSYFDEKNCEQVAKDCNATCNYAKVSCP